VNVAKRAVGGCSGAGLWSSMCSSRLGYGNGFLGILFFIYILSPVGSRSPVDRRQLGMFTVLLIICLLCKHSAPFSGFQLELRTYSTRKQLAGSERKTNMIADEVKALDR